MSAKEFEPVNLACKPLKTLDLFLGTDFKRFINNPLLARILFTKKTINQILYLQTFAKTKQTIFELSL